MAAVMMVVVEEEEEEEEEGWGEGQYLSLGGVHSVRVHRDLH